MSKAWVSCSCLSGPYCVRLCPCVPRRLPAVRICRNMVSSWRVYFQICSFRKLALNCGLEFCFSWFSLGVGDLVLCMRTSGLAILGLFLFFLNLVYVLSFLCFSIKSCPPGDVLSLKALLTVFICSRFSFLKVLVFLVFLSSVTYFWCFLALICHHPPILDLVVWGFEAAHLDLCGVCLECSRCLFSFSFFWE